MYYFILHSWHEELRLREDKPSEGHTSRPEQLASTPVFVNYLLSAYYVVWGLAV